jgi:uncharacterized membrane protein
MQVRPKLKINLTLADLILEIICWLTLIGVWLMTLFNYSNLPNIIPIHFNATGQVDGYGSKVAIIILPIIATFLFFGMTILNKFPHIFNYATNITPDNALQYYTAALRLMRYLKFIIVLIFALILFQTLRIVTGKSEGLGTYFLPMILSLIFLPPLLFILKSVRAKKGEYCN